MWNGTNGLVRESDIGHWTSDISVDRLSFGGPSKVQGPESNVYSPANPEPIRAAESPAGTDPEASQALRSVNPIGRAR